MLGIHRAIFSQNLNGIDCLNKNVNRYHTKIPTYFFFQILWKCKVSYLGYLAETHYYTSIAYR